MIHIVPVQCSWGEGVCDATNEKTNDESAKAARRVGQGVHSEHLPPVLWQSKPCVTVGRHEGLPRDSSGHCAVACSDVRKVLKETAKEETGMSKKSRSGGEVCSVFLCFLPQKSPDEALRSHLHTRLLRILTSARQLQRALTEVDQGFHGSSNKGGNSYGRTEAGQPQFRYRLLINSDFLPSRENNTQTSHRLRQRVAQEAES